MERYVAFISYSHRDERAARWLHRAIEGYRFPRAIVGQPSEFGLLRRKLPPVFRDRDELPASGDLNSELCAALADSRFQIVLCSPAAAKSRWVNEEIIQFKRIHGEHRTLALILEGEPYSGGEEECFPPALRFHVRPDGQLGDEPAEPIAADLRKGKDGRRLALQKLLAGLSGVRLDTLVRRENARRHHRLTLMFAAATSVAVVTIGLAIYAEFQRRVAVEQRELADRSLEFLVGTFEIANPATENPRTITALTILDRASRQAAREFGNEPTVSSRLLRTTGGIYRNLGLHEESERDLRGALARTPEHGEARAATLLQLASVARGRAEASAAQALVEQAARSYDRTASYAPPLNAELAFQRANVAFLRADYELAGDLYGEAVRLFRGLPGDNREDTGNALIRQASSRIQTGDYDRANILYRQAAELIAAKFGMNDVRTAKALHAQAYANFENGRPVVAARTMQRAIAIYGRVLEGNHPNLGEAQLLLGRINASLGQSALALAAFARARQIFVALYGPLHPTVGDIDFFTAEAEILAGRYPEALARAASAKVVYDAVYGPDDPDQAEVLLLRSRILQAAGRFEEARANCNNALGLQQRIGLSAADVASTRDQCADIPSRIARAN
jgi:tetratricopeptide (TPR) repeat protein